MTLTTPDINIIMIGSIILTFDFTDNEDGNNDDDCVIDDE